MSKYLRIHPGADGDGGGIDYQLPADADLEQIAEQIATALDGGRSLLIPIDRIYGQSARSAYVVINGALVSQVQIGEVAISHQATGPPPPPAPPR